MNPKLAALERKSNPGVRRGYVRRQYVQDIGIRLMGGMTGEREDFNPHNMPPRLAHMNLEMLKKYIRDRWYGYGESPEEEEHRHEDTKWKGGGAADGASGEGASGGAGGKSGGICMVEWTDPMTFPCPEDPGTATYYSKFNVVAKPKGCGGRTITKSQEVNASCTRNEDGSCSNERGESPEGPTLIINGGPSKVPGSG